jgi:lycopene beta-cyclase
MSTITEISFLGGGVSAHVYALAAHSVMGERAPTIGMIDPTTDAPDRTLCVWGEPIPMLRGAVVAQWRYLLFGHGASTTMCDLGEWTYRQYTAGSIRRLADAMVRIDRTVDVASDPTDRSILSLDSRPAQPMRSEASVSLLQHFRGWRIVTEHHVFDPKTAVMMDFRTDQTDGVCFMYVLPYSPTEALVECTVFGPSVWSAEQYHQRLRTYIADIVGCAEYRILSAEEGVIPMNDRQPIRDRGDNWIAIGAAAGLTKPTTGYTVARCVRDAITLFTQLQRNGTATVPAPPSRRFAWYDRLLLRIIRDEPQVVPTILYTLFRKNPVRRILLFLDERTTLGQEIALFWTLPWMPFLRAIVRR